MTTVEAKPNERLQAATAILPTRNTETTITIAQMRQALRAADCLYDNKSFWKQLGAKEVPAIPDAVVKEAYEKGGRVILRCSSISAKAKALQATGSAVFLGEGDNPVSYSENVSPPKWIVVPSHINAKTVGVSKKDVITAGEQMPTPEDWFAVLAYARLDGGRQPKGCENLGVFTSKDEVVVCSGFDYISVVCDVGFSECYGSLHYGAACFGLPQD